MLVFVLLAAAVFAFVNGTSDLSAMSGAAVATRAARVWQARLLAACGACAGILLGGEAVAQTVAHDLIVAERLPSTDAPMAVWGASLGSAIAWGAYARRRGIPTSATHALVGSVLGSALALSGDLGSVHWGVRELVAEHRLAGVTRVVCGLLVSPLLGSLAGGALFAAVGSVLVRGSRRVNRGVRRLQWAGLLLQSWFYGANDGHVVVGIVAGAASSVPAGWAHGAVAACVVLGGLWGSAAVMRRMGRCMLRLGPLQALAAQSGAAAAIGGAAALGAPASSTQVTASAVVGVGGAWRAAHVRWREVRAIVAAWLLTIPVAGLLGAAVGAALRPAL